MKNMTLAMIIAAAFVFAAPMVTAEEVGLSGQCYNGDGTQGGKDELRVGTDGVQLLSVLGAVNALAMFAVGSAEDANTGSACDRYDCGPGFEDCDGRPERKDYLEVHVDGGLAGYVQVCYEGKPTVSTSGPACPHSPPGKGTDHGE
ncbi:MAG: hypothetical protein KY455_14090 [Euryarchaeota archaeon]|nr:hypothetical protein [Euryarchaeota archaeon]